MKELLYLKDEQIKEFIEKLFLSYRDTFLDSKSILSKYSLGIAHNKVLHILSTYRGITIGELLDKLKITKQSLNRILRDLIKIDVVRFEKDSKDTRVKHVYLNDKGEKIFDEIFSKQKKRIYKALVSSSAKEVVDFNKVLKKLINQDERI
tara:strand:+ start:410 stop:859 length:450 start_codon:yes stop_codon:yes gene_type:complete